jgi:hypothetical protein
MTTSRLCLLHPVLTPPRIDPHYLFLTLFYPLYSSLYSSLYPLPRQQHTYHRGRPCRLCRQQPLYRETDRHILYVGSEIHTINSLLTTRHTKFVLQLFMRLNCNKAVVSNMPSRLTESLCQVGTPSRRPSKKVKVDGVTD